MSDRPKSSIRIAETSDLAVLVSQQDERESEYPPSELIERWVNAGEFWVAERKSQIIGWMSLQYTFYEEGFVSILWVDQRYRRLGVASDLLRKARSICKTDRIWTSTNESNQPMRSLMQSLNWEYSGSVRHLDPGDPELIFCNERV